MASGRNDIGRVVAHRGRGRSESFRIDFGRRWGPRYLYSLNGVPFPNREMAEAVLAHVRMEVSRGRAIDDILSEFAPRSSKSARIEVLLPRWLELFEKMVEAGDRQPRTLREYRRWSGQSGGPEAHFSYWFGRSLFEVDTGAVQDWSYELADKGLSPKTRRNVLAGFHVFLNWAADHFRSFSVPKFVWPEDHEHIPTLLTADAQWQVLSAIPDDRRGIFLAMALLLLRPSEARVLCIRDWRDGQLWVERAAKDRRVGGLVRGPKKATGKKVLPVTGPLREWLEAHVTAQDRLSRPDDPLFENPRGRHGWWSETSMKRAWYAACDKAGVSRVGLYEGTKHSSATDLKSRGADDRLLARIMGHRDTRSVEKYAKLTGAAIEGTLNLRKFE